MNSTRTNERDSDLVASIKCRLADPDGPTAYRREEVAALLDAYEALAKRFDRVVKISDGYQYELKVTTDELQTALTSVKILKGFISICSSCKKVRTDDGYWRHLELYLSDNSEATLTHGLCPDCNSNYLQLSSFTDDPGVISPCLSLNLQDIDLENPVISHYIGIVNNNHFDDTPLRGDLLRLLEKYILLERRQRRIAKISDNYQLEVTEIKEKFEREARIDHLTGLANRRDMFRVLETEITRVTSDGGSLSLVLFDFDSFKTINDTYGHEAGNQMLQHGVRMLQDIMRQEDTCARWGDDEFMIILPDSNEERIFLTAEKLRLIIELNPLLYKGKKIKTTISLGVAVYKHGESLNNTLYRVDSSINDAKKQGKNRVGPLLMA